MRIEMERTFAASPEDVHAALVDEATQAAKAEALSALDYDMSTSEVGTRFEVTTRRRMPTSGLPEFVRSLVKGSMTVVETERWEQPQPDGSRDAEFLLDIDGAPVQLRGSAHLQPTGGGCRLVWGGDLEATVPFFRTRIAEAASASVIETIEIEFDLLARRLGESTQVEPRSATP